MSRHQSAHLTSEQQAIRRRLQNVRERLIRLHKALLDSERVSYERTFGNVGTAGEFLQLVISDPWFAWLRPISELIVLIDQSLDGEEPVTVEGGEALVKTARELLAPTETGEGFSQHYFEALQRDPDVVLAHGGLAKAFGRSGS